MRELLVREVLDDLGHGVALVRAQADDQIVLAALCHDAQVGEIVAGSLRLQVIEGDAQLFLCAGDAVVGHVVEVLVAQAAGAQDQAHVNGAGLGLTAARRRGSAGGPVAAGRQRQRHQSSHRQSSHFLEVHSASSFFVSNHVKLEMA